MTRATQPTPFHEVLEYLGDGSTNEVLAQGLADLVQRVCTTGKKGTVTLVVSVVPADDGRVEITDKVSVKMPELYRPPRRVRCGRGRGADGFTAVPAATCCRVGVCGRRGVRRDYLRGAVTW